MPIRRMSGKTFSRRLRFGCYRQPEITTQLRELRALLERQSEVDRALLLLYLEGNSHREIGEVLGFRETNVGTRLNRLKKTLRQSVHSSEIGPQVGRCQLFVWSAVYSLWARHCSFLRPAVPGPGMVAKRTGRNLRKRHEKNQGRVSTLGQLRLPSVERRRLKFP